MNVVCQLASNPSWFVSMFRFVVMRLFHGTEKKGALQAFGGAWDPELDGGDPDR